MRYTWDEDKAIAVEHEHAIAFAKIIDIFSDPYAVEFVDEKHSTEKEVRYAIIGLTARYGLTYLVFTERESELGDLELHFITAWRARGWMVNEYEENKERL